MAEDRKRLKYELNRQHWLKVANPKDEDFRTEYYEKAKQQYMVALQHDEAFANSYKGLGQLYKAQGKIDEAIINMEKYLSLKPNARDNRFYKATISRLKQAKKEEAENEGDD